MRSGRVSSACARCRRQKLKCDISRPCVMCVRASASCVNAEQHIWRAEDPARRCDQLRAGLPRAPDRPRKRLRTMSTQPSKDVESEITESGEATSRPDRGPTAASDEADEVERTEHTDRPPPQSGAWGGSSSTMELVARAFHHHDPASIETPETSALGYSRTPCGSGPDGPSLGNYRLNSQRRQPRFATQELWDVLPEWEVVSVLIENYFNKIHWFVLLFHQGEFRRSSRELFPVTSSPGRLRHDSQATGRVAVLLAVCVLSLECLDTGQDTSLSKCGVEAQTLQDRILAALKFKLLDILAHGSLESVQVTVLLGNYYLYRGEPELAWPLCGCALRLAQAVNLHRRSQTLAGVSHPRQIVEARKRCWWAIYEIETFMSMIYGFPLSISDDECDVEPLDAHDPWSLGVGGHPSSPNSPTLLSYKCSVSELYKIVKSALTGLYRSSQGSGSLAKPQPVQSEQGPSRREAIIKKIVSLDVRLSRWYSELPVVLKMDILPEVDPDCVTHGDYFHPDIASRTFDSNLLRLQALALKLAYENTRILIHRPLLPYSYLQRFGPPADPSRAEAPRHVQTFHALLQSCRDAAIQVSRSGSLPVFQEAADTFAVNFISLHILTAAVALCMMVSSNPLSPVATESKVGIRRIMQMQALLRPRSTVAEQGLQVVQRLLELVMQKETRALLDIDATIRPPQAPQNEDAHVSEDLQRERGLDYRRTRTAGTTRLRSEFLWGPDTEEPSAARCHSEDNAPEGVDTAAQDDYEDTLSTLAILDFEQAMSNVQATERGSGDYIPPFPLDLMSSFESFGQDQNWLWDPAFDATYMGHNSSL